MFFLLLPALALSFTPAITRRPTATPVPITIDDPPRGVALPPCLGLQGQGGRWVRGSPKGSPTPRSHWEPRDASPVCHRYNAWNGDNATSDGTLPSAAACFMRAGWVVMAGDSNQRGLYLALLVALRRIPKTVVVESHRPRSRHDDRDAIVIMQDGVERRRLRLSFRFVRSLDQVEHDGSADPLASWRRMRSNRQQRRQQQQQQRREDERPISVDYVTELGMFSTQYEADHHQRRPSTLIISLGLWDLSCKDTQALYHMLDQRSLMVGSRENTRTERGVGLADGVPRVMMFTPALIAHHDRVTNRDIRGVATCAKRAMDDALFQRSELAATKRNTIGGDGSYEQRPAGLVSLMDTIALTEGADPAWVGMYRGIHYAAGQGWFTGRGTVDMIVSDLSPVGVAIGARVIGFVCGGQ